jgi:DNA repair protein RadA/Sms
MHRAPAFACSSCGTAAPRWSGRCGACGEWNALTEVAPPRQDPGEPRTTVTPVPLSSVDPAAARPFRTGVGEVDRVLAGGLTPGSVTLLFGEPGVGKSTLLLQVLAAVAGRGTTALLVSAEESVPQVRARADRLGDLSDHLLALDGGDLDAALDAVEASRPRVVVVDSVQTVSSPSVAGAPGSVAQVRGCAERLAELARRTGVAVVLVGHVTKDGDPAGPRALEHVVDTVLSFEGDRHHALRVLRALKHRFGPTGEIGLFEMGDAGLRDVEEPGRLLLGDRRAEVPGSAVTALLEGRRPLLAEVQALAVRSYADVTPKRNAQGLDTRRLAVVLAVLERRTGLRLPGVDVYTSLAGGLHTAEPATDLPVALAVTSAVFGTALPSTLVSFGEIGLAGELRQVVGAPRRLAEASRLGFTHALVPAATADGPPGMTLVRAPTIGEALEAMRPHARRVPEEPSVAVDTIPAWSTTGASH